MLADAEDFLGAALDLLKTGRWSKVCFSSQQVAELGLKAVLHKLAVERLGHALIELLDEMVKNIADAKRFTEHAKVLDQYHIPTRYPNAFPSGSVKDPYTKTQAEQAFRLASELLVASLDTIRFSPSILKHRS